MGAQGGRTLRRLGIEGRHRQRNAPSGAEWAGAPTGHRSVLAYDISQCRYKTSQGDSRMTTGYRQPQHQNQNHNQNRAGAAGASFTYDCVRCPNSVGVVKTLGSSAMLCAECAVERLLQPKSPRRPDAPDVTLQITATDLALMLGIAYEEGKIAGMPPEVDEPAAPAAPAAPAPAPAQRQPAPPRSQAQEPRQRPPVDPSRQPPQAVQPPPPEAQPQAPTPASAAPGIKACKACQQPIQPQYTYCIEHRPPLCGQCGVNKLSWSTQRGDWFEVCYTCRPQRRAAA